MRFSQLLCLTTFALGRMQASADIVLYSSSFGGAGGTNLNGQAVDTSGATGAQHTQYGTSASAAWSAATAYKADGSFVESGGGTDNANRVSATVVFTPQNGYIYNLTMTTSFTQQPTAAFHAVGFFETSGYSGNINSATGADVWALTRPGDASFDNQVAHYNLAGGAGNIGSGNLDTTAPSTLRITLDTTGGAGNWAATYYVGDGSGGFNLLGSVADLNAVTIASVGIGVYNADGAANFQFFELSVTGGDTTAPSITGLNPDGVSDVYPGTTLVANFSEHVALTGIGTITINDTAGSNDITIDVSNSSQASVSGNTLTLTPPANLAFATNYEVVIAPGTIQDAASPPNTFPGTTAGQWTFSTAAQDLSAPLITLKSPADNASEVSRTTHIVATFDDNLIPATGNIVIKDLVDGSTTRTISITDSSQVTISGNVLTIIPATPLAAGRGYAVQIAAGAVLNFSDVPFSGIPENDESTWNFVTTTAPLRIMPMGDSITVGYTNADWTGGAFEFGYRSGLYTLLTQAGYDFQYVGSSTEPWTFRDPVTTDPAWPPALNLADLGQDGHNGYAGKTASYLNTGISSWLATSDPDVILLKIGTNSQDQAGLQTLVNTIATTKPDCRLIIAQIMPKYTFQQGIVDYNTWIRDTLVPGQQALGRNVTVVNQYAPFLTNPADLTSIDQTLFSNEINHPSNPGYDKMAQVWFNAIEALGFNPNTFSNWMAGFPGVGGQTGLNDDSDGDGIMNGIENFFGTAPDEWSPGIAVGTVDSAQGTFTFTHPQGVLAVDLTAAYRWSKDLQIFHGDLQTDAGGTTIGFTIEADTPEPGTTTVTATVTGTVCDRLFLRVQVTEN